MQNILPPLRRGNSGDAVANLQDALLFLIQRERLRFDDPAQREQLVTALAPERVRADYRDATIELVTFFQRQQNLAPEGAAGDVDRGTAERLNALLRSLGAFDAVSLSPLEPRVVAGQVLDADGQPFRGTVTLISTQTPEGLRLGEDTTDPEGRYAISYVPRAADDPLRVAAFDDRGQRRSEQAFGGTKPVEVINLVVEGTGRQFRVSGKVGSATRAGTGGLRVALIDQSVGSETLLAEATTAADGSYQTAFAYAGAKPKPDIFARVFSGEALLGASSIRYNAGNTVVLDVPLQAAAAPALASEHETLVTNLKAHFAGGLTTLEESEARQDVTYLANKSGWDARAVALASLSEQFSARTGEGGAPTAVPPALFYALFRAGVPANESAVYRLDPAQVETVWQQSIARGVVPAALAATLPAAVEQFRGLAARQALAAPARTGRSSLGEMLAMSLPNATPVEREQFAQLQVQHRAKPAALWRAVTATLGEPASRRLQLDGQLAFVTLNNAPLIARLHAAAVDRPLTAPVDLVAQGFHRAEKWAELIGDDALPPEVPGDTVAAKRQNYSGLLAAQLRLSYPTASVAAMVRSGETSLAFAASDKVQAFLLEHQADFEIGRQPVEQFAVTRQIPIEPEVQQDITRIQRVRQITPSDLAMNALLKQGVDSAYAVVRYDRDEFVAAFQGEVGGPEVAALIHAKAQQVHGAVLNIAMSYLVTSNAPEIGVHSPPQIVAPAPNVPANVGDVIAYASLEKLLGEMDYAECEHCRSILSPAAYLVNLLQFLDRDAVRWTQFRTQWKATHHNVPYPHTFAKLQDWVDAGSPAEITSTPLEVLLQRRPDVQHLPLTCENTETPLPYIDVVNETLEHFVAHDLKLDDYRGHSTDDSATLEELLANPQFVEDTAFLVLAGKSAPAPLLPPTPLLPFHQPLERLRRLFAAFAVPLPVAMETVRKGDALERASDGDYGWRDIWMEELRLSRAEYSLLTDRTASLAKLYGYPAATTDADVIAALSPAKDFTRRLEITYEDLVAILQTRFVNPHSDLIPQLERLGVPLTTLQAVKAGTLTDAEFAAALAPRLDPAAYGGDIKAWVTDETNFRHLMSLLVLTDPTGANEVGSFDRLEFRYADPARAADRVRALEFVRLLRFIRLWKKLGWTITQTDQALTALFPADLLLDDADDNVNLARLDQGFLGFLPRLGVVRRVISRLKLKLATELPALLACFAPIGTHGSDSLYRRLFLNPSLLKQDGIFAGDGFGHVLDGSAKVNQHEETLRAALNVAAEEFARIGAALGFDANTPLTVANVSAVFRRAWLARKLKLSVAELALLTAESGIDPFGAIDPAAPGILSLFDLLDGLRATGLKPAEALYLIWNRDLSGRAMPDAAQLNEFARTLRAGFAAIDREFALDEDPDGQIARARMGLVYDTATTDLFFGLLNNALLSDVPYSHPQPALEKAILDAAPGRLSYDDFRKRLAFGGVMTLAIRDALKAVAGVGPAFQDAIDQLHQDNDRIVGPFFARYAELLPLYTSYAASGLPPEQRRTALLANFLPTLQRRRKHQQALQLITAAADTVSAFAETTLQSLAILQSDGLTGQPAVEDLIAVERTGPAVSFFLRDTATGAIDRTEDAVGALDYRATGPNSLPANSGLPLSGVWRGYLEAPSSEFYQLRIRTETDATVALELNGSVIGLNRDGSLWTNASPIELRAGQIQAFTLTVEKVTAVLEVSWRTTGRGWEIIPARYLYSANLLAHLQGTYVRFFKAASLSKALPVTAAEFAFLASAPEYLIAGAGWLNRLPVNGTADAATAAALGQVLKGLVRFARLKAALSPNDEQLLAVLSRPAEAAAKPDGMLYVLTRWEPSAVDATLGRLGRTVADLARVEVFGRVFDALELARQLGLSAAALFAAATNEPDATRARDLQAALRARYVESDWLEVIKPVNDALRSLQRDALVAYILHQMRANPASAHIDTADKLFEYFLMDVQMEPVTQTSRIRHALSSVQLFIQRCLMNLEPRVSSAAINARQWESLRLYRVCEANLKVFLWPENWCEPELRDDQSPFFKELTSELLQGDITEDRAANALATYLGKVEEVAKLEPCSIHFVENEPGTADDVAHVVARTTGGANRKYFYRRREHGYWTPWEQIKLEIEDNPVVPVIWKGRLFLFWVRLLKQTDTATKSPAAAMDVDLTKLKPADIPLNPPKVVVQALLCWSEYFDRKWQPAVTSDVDRPTTLGVRNLTGPFAFDRSVMTLDFAEEGTALRIRIGGGTGSFLLYTPRGMPLREEEAGLPKYVQQPDRLTTPFVDRLTGSSGKLSVDYDPGTGSGDDNLGRNLLEYGNGGRTVRPLHALGNAWESPFFFEDNAHVFYVTTTQDTVQVDQWNEYGTGSGLGMAHYDIPQLYLEKPRMTVPDVTTPGVKGSYLTASDATTFTRYVNADTPIKKALGLAKVVPFGDQVIGPAGRITSIKELP